MCDCWCFRAGKVALFLHGHTTHVGRGARLFAQSRGILLFLFPPHLTHLLQPLDLSVFSTHQKGYREGVRKFVSGRRAKNVPFVVALRECSRAYLQALSPSNLVNGFAAAGIFPWDPSKGQSALDQFRQQDPVVIPASQAESDEQVASQVLSPDLSKATSSASVYAAPARVLAESATQYDNNDWRGPVRVPRCIKRGGPVCNDEFDRVEVLNRERERLVIIRDPESSKMACAQKIDEKIRKLFQTANEAKVQVVLNTQQRLLRECEREKQQRDKAEEKERKRREKEERVRAQAEKRAPAQPEPPAPAPALAPAPAPAPAPTPAPAQAPEPAHALVDSVGRADSLGKRQLHDLDTGVGTPPSAKVFRSRVKYPTPP